MSPLSEYTYQLLQLSLFQLSKPKRRGYFETRQWTGMGCGWIIREYAGEGFLGVFFYNTHKPKQQRVQSIQYCKQYTIYVKISK